MDKGLEILQTFFIDAISLIWDMFIIIFVVMIVLETLKAFNILYRINNFTYQFTKFLGISKTANFPLLVGIIIGMSYGAGVIIASYKNGDMNKKDVILVIIFLSMCHAIVEDTLLMRGVGANIYVILIIRLGLGITVTAIANQIITRRKIYERS